MAQLLTNPIVKAFAVPEKGIRLIYDNAVAGFACQISAGGARSFILRYRPHGHGRFPYWSAGRARAEARRLRRKVAAGSDLIAAPDPRPGITAKFLLFIAQGVAPACYLYLHYHPNGDLLYVGIYLHALTRQHHHVKEASWRKEICHIVIEPYATREEALEAERIAIKTEFPKFNTTHNGHRHPFQEVAQLETRVITAHARSRRDVDPTTKQTEKIDE
jgi:hypothetical protein